MSGETRKFVLDSSVFLVYLLQEPGWKTAEHFLLEGRKKNYHLYLNALNMGEILYTVYDKAGRDAKGRQMMDAVQDFIKASSIELVTPNQVDIIDATLIKTKGGLSYMDSFVLMTSRKLDATVLVRDAEFSKFSPEFAILQI